MQISVGVAVGPDLSLDVNGADYLSLDTVVLYLQESPVFDYQGGLFGIHEDGRMMGIVNDRDIVTFPLYEDGDAIAPKDGIALDRIRAAAVATGQ